ncbi:hypothetical protein CY34DRAFT_638137 [Suillus luteus UH-Slu-Lm8-n1]|uniref:Uncharacterized protein n=1 Tax=Suillus luteus UH-Slu-Lm8-n1 TaxID=930992 RepID=A0A0D0ARK4_9AGAM|nr:hypothetical protein CY34DRAFT_638137 [Suillus luteus UH-Slu-Lm8-n1]
MDTAFVIQALALVPHKARNHARFYPGIDLSNSCIARMNPLSSDNRRSTPHPLKTKRRNEGPEFLDDDDDDDPDQRLF